MNSNDTQVNQLVLNLISKVYVKENGQWVQKDDYENIFNVLKNYKRINLI